MKRRAHTIELWAQILLRLRRCYHDGRERIACVSCTRSEARDGAPQPRQVALVGPERRDCGPPLALRQPTVSHRYCKLRARRGPHSQNPPHPLKRPRVSLQAIAAQWDPSRALPHKHCLTLASNRRWRRIVCPFLTPQRAPRACFRRLTTVGETGFQEVTAGQCGQGGKVAPLGRSESCAAVARVGMYVGQSGSP